jgi:hypothetical protein
LQSSVSGVHDAGKPLFGLASAGQDGVLRIVLAALLLRTVILAAAFVQNPYQWGSGIEAASIANSLAAGHGFSSPFLAFSGPTAWMAPVYPALEALLFVIFGSYSPAAALVLLLLNAVFSSMTAAAVYFLGKELFGREVGLWAGWIWALSPYTIKMSLKLWETSLSALLVVLGFLLYLRLRDSASLRDWVLLALFWAFAGLTNTALLVFLPFWWTMLVACRIRSGRPWLAPLALSLMVFAAAMTPWMVRNHLRFGGVVPIRGNFGVELWVANHEGTSGPNDRTALPLANAHEFVQYRALGEALYARQKQREAFAFIKSHPRTYLANCVRRVVHFWTDSEGVPGWGVISLLLMMIGLGVGLHRNPRQALPFLFTVAVYPIVYYAVHTLSWYRHPIEPIMTVLIANGLVAMTHKFPLVSR